MYPSHCSLNTATILCYIIVLICSYHVCYHGKAINVPAFYQLLQSELRGGPVWLDRISHVLSKAPCDSAYAALGSAGRFPK